MVITQAFNHRKAAWKLNHSWEIVLTRQQQPRNTTHFTHFLAAPTHLACRYPAHLGRRRLGTRSDVFRCDRISSLPRCCIYLSAYCSFDVRFLDGQRLQMNLAQENICLPEYEPYDSCKYVLCTQPMLSTRFAGSMST